ncbi:MULTISPECIES: NADP-dependent oxidoreductase [Nocardia]|uniref:NADP-dependent oxidoreductase n=1 Tax=Nocardia TaxID=1817 RepID=UPI001E3FFDFE|nr:MULTISPECIES: NADP-dependent oxidoreductase [Nocardia]
MVTPRRDERDAVPARLGVGRRRVKAISQRTLGGPDVLETIDVPIPEPGRGEVLVRLGATSVNTVDCALRSGRVRFLGPPPFTVGFDLSGTVVGVGPDVTEFGSGDAVFGMVHSRTGTYCEYVVARADRLGPRPAGLDDLRAAALPTAASTAWQGVVAANPQVGERVLVHAAAGGVGHFAVQFARQRGAHVIGTARAVNHEFPRGLGVDEVIDYTTTDFTTVLDGVDVVFDLVGGAYGQRSLRVLRADGRYITAQESDAVDDPRCRRITARPRPAELVAIGELAVAGDLYVHLDRVLPLDDVVLAHALSESGHSRGKVVLTPWK